MEKYMDYVLEQLKTIMAVDSPSGYTKNLIEYLAEELDRLGFSYKKTIKGGLVADLGGKDETNGLVIGAHADTLGAMVTEIKPNGRLKLTPIGGLNANNIEAENV